MTRPCPSAVACRRQRRRYIFVLPRAVRKTSLSARLGPSGPRKISGLQPWKDDFTHNPKTLNITLPASSYFLYKASSHKSLRDVDNGNTTSGRHMALLGEKRKIKISAGQVERKERHLVGLRFWDANPLAKRKSKFSPTCLVLQEPSSVFA